MSDGCKRRPDSDDRTRGAIDSVWGITAWTDVEKLGDLRGATRPA